MVTYDTRGPQFESSHQQNFVVSANCWKDENKQKEAGKGPLKLFSKFCLNVTTAGQGKSHGQVVMGREVVSSNPNTCIQEGEKNLMQFL